MTTYNDDIPNNLDMQWVKGDKFTFLNNKIIVWSNKECGVGFEVESYDGELLIKRRPQEDPIETITTSSGGMIFSGNEITFSKLDLNLKVDKYYYSLKLIDKIDTSEVGTLLEGRFKVKN